MSKWLTVLEAVGKIALNFIPGGTVIAPAIGMVEQISSQHSLTSDQKKNLAIQLALTSANFVNQIKGKDVIDVNALGTAVSSGIDSVVHATNIAAKEQ